MAQVILGSLLDRPHDAVGAYYRSRPMLLTLGLSLEDAFAAPMGKSGGFSNGRDIGVVCNLPKADGPIVLPMSGDVGSQYTPAVGWAQGITYHRDVLGDRGYDGSIAVVLGGEASVATNGFWSALTIATTLIAADALLYRGQRLRHLGPVQLPDAGRQRRGQPCVVPRSPGAKWRWHRARRTLPVCFRRRWPTFVPGMAPPCSGSRCPG